MPMNLNRAPLLPADSVEVRAHRLRGLALGTFAVQLVALLILAAMEPGTLHRRLVTLAGLGLIILPVLALNRLGRTTLASWIFVLGLVALLTQRAWITGGVYAPVLPFYVLFVMMGGILLNRAGVYATAIACLAGTLVLIIGQSAGHTPAHTHPALDAMFVFFTMLIGLSVLLHSMMGNAFRDALNRAEVEMTERKATQARLEVAEELAVSHEQLRAIEKLRDELVQMIVHDMRGLLTVVIANLEMARTNVSGETVQDITDAISAASTISRMTKNVLDVSRLEEGKMPINRTKTDVAALAKETARTFGAMDTSRTIRCACDDPVIALCDPELVRRVMENLVSNAIKHAPSGGRVSIDARHEGSEVRVSVQDDGPGIPEEVRANLFEKFAATNKDTRFHSAGLGLAFSRLAVAAQGGRIWVEPAKPNGTTFVFAIPSGGNA